MKSEWKPIEEHPVTVQNGNDSNPLKSLLYGPQTGIVIGNVFMFPDRMEPIATCAGLHGNLIDDWGVTHWMPLPDPPQSARDGAK